ncbi:MAG TPA: exopolysaccharide biosynthesis protein [Thermoanaerobaculia bacterium]
MQPGPNDSIHEKSLAETLQGVVDSMPPEGVTLAQIRDLIGREGMMLLTMFLTIVFLVPISIPGVSTVFGGAILVISLSRLMKRPIWLPARLERRVVPSDKLSKAMDRGMKWVRRLERLSRPHRMPSLASGKLMSVLNNGGLIVGAILLMAPFGLIPFSNTLPALAILFFAIGILQRDGVCTLLGHVMNVATGVYFAVLIGGGAVAIQKLWQQITG